VRVAQGGVLVAQNAPSAPSTHAIFALRAVLVA
jgi:hypothetical protein